jgi:branched-chain amino acid transport system substrate-binding protein
MRRYLKLTAATAGVAALCVSTLTNLATAQESQPLKIGILGDMTGTFSAVSGKGSVIAAQMAIDDFGGKVLGRKIEILTGDHQNKADIGAAIAKRWYENEGVTMITDIVGSAVGLAVQGEARRAKRIAIFTGAGATDLTGKQCSDTGCVWSFDTYALSSGTATSLLQEGLDTWYFLTPDFVFGHQLQQNATAIVNKRGGKVLGTSTFPLTNQDFSSFVLTAQASKAKVIVMTGGDIAAAVKQASEFGIMSGGQRMSSMLLWLPFAKGIGTKIGQGLYATNSFYWDMNDAARSWSKRYQDKAGSMPTMNHAGTYSATLHYLKAMQKAGTADVDAVVKEMRAMPVEDQTAKGSLRVDGRLMRDFYLWQIKTPAESKGEWDIFKLVRTIPADDAALPLAESECPLLKK